MFSLPIPEPNMKSILPLKKSGDKDLKGCGRKNKAPA